MAFEKTASRLWKRLGKDERLTAAAAFWKEPPEDMAGTALAAIARSRHLRPQVARALGPEERTRALAALLEPGEGLAASLLVALHLSERRPLLARFLDALGLPHEEGILKDEDDARSVSADEARAGTEALLSAFPPSQVQTYLNTLWLQDPERWAALPHSAEWDY